MKYIFTPGEPDYAYIKKSVCSLQAEYPFLKVEIAGRSTCGRKIFALRFGRSANPVLIAACFHAQERLTALVTLRFTERLCLRRMPRTAVALHSQGEEIYYEYGEHTPERGEHLAKIFAAASGYTLVQNAGLASHAGFKDWTIEALGIPSFTFELGKGKNPLPLSDFESVYKSIEETLVLACVM